MLTFLYLLKWSLKNSTVSEKIVHLNLFKLYLSILRVLIHFNYKSTQYEITKKEVSKTTSFN